MSSAGGFATSAAHYSAPRGFHDPFHVTSNSADLGRTPSSYNYCYADGNFWSWRLVQFDSCSPPSRKTFRHVVGRRTTRCIASATGAGEPVQCGRIFSRSSCAHPSLSGTIKYGTSVIFLSFHWPFCLTYSSSMRAATRKDSPLKIGLASM